MNTCIAKKINETSLPDKKAYNESSLEDITDKDFAHA